MNSALVSTTRPSRAPKRVRVARAYALPLVILVSLAASLAIGIVLSRHADSQLAVKRQVLLYRDHHRQMGMQELVDRWLINVVTRGTIRDQLGDGGLAFELILPHGATAKVFFEDAQGSALEDLRVIHGPEATSARRLLRVLDQLPLPTDPAQRALVFREFGPSKISALSASPVVLEALGQVIVPQGDSRRFVRTLIDRRERTTLMPSDIRAIATESGLDGEQAAAAELVLTVQPTLWRVTAIIAGPGVRQRASGLVEVPTIIENSGAGRFAKFLTWNEE